MIFGMIDEDQPLIPVLIGWRLGAQSYLALMDTGFTGDVKVSPEIANDLGLVVTHTETIALGNDQVIEINASFAAVMMEGVLKPVTVLIDRGMPMIGMSFLKKFGYALTIDYKTSICTLQK